MKFPAGGRGYLMLLYTDKKDFLIFAISMVILIGGILSLTFIIGKLFSDELTKFVLQAATGIGMSLCVFKFWKFFWR